MLTISIREFQLHAGDYLDKLPLVLTRYNIPVARVEPITVGEVSKVGQKILEKNPEEVDKFELGDNRAKYSAGR